MRLRSALLATFCVFAMAGSAVAQGYQRPYDPYPWCAVYGGNFGGSNCGFLTWQQCMATVSGIGGFCQPNQFYNPRASADRPRKQPQR
jgi:hypothetical protein